MLGSNVFRDVNIALGSEEVVDGDTLFVKVVKKLTDSSRKIDECSREWSTATNYAE